MVGLAGLQQMPEWTVVATGKGNQPFNMLRQGVEIDLRTFAGGRVQEGLRGKLEEIAVADFILGKQDQAPRFLPAPLARIDREVDCEGRPDNGLHAGFDTGEGELQSAKQVAGIGHGNGRHLEALAEFDDPFEAERAFGQRKRGMDVEVYELRVGHQPKGFIAAVPCQPNWSGWVEISVD